MAKPKLTAKTPDSEKTNALIGRHDELIADMSKRRYAIVELAVPEYKHHRDGGDQATVNIVHIELVDGADEEATLKVFDRVFKNRTGDKVRPSPEPEQTQLEIPDADTDPDAIGI